MGLTAVELGVVTVEWGVAAVEATAVRTATVEERVVEAEGLAAAAEIYSRKSITWSVVPSALQVSFKLNDR